MVYTWSDLQNLALLRCYGSKWLINFNLKSNSLLDHVIRFDQIWKSSYFQLAFSFGKFIFHGKWFAKHWFIIIHISTKGHLSLIHNSGNFSIQVDLLFLVANLSSTWLRSNQFTSTSYIFIFVTRYLAILILNLKFQQLRIGLFFLKEQITFNLVAHI